MRKEICFITVVRSPGNGLFCCCRQSEVRNPSPTWSGKWNEAADPNLNPMQAVETESIGNSRAGSTSTRRSAKGGKKKKNEEKPCLVAADDNWCLLGHSAFRPDLSHRLYPDPFSNASNCIKIKNVLDSCGMLRVHACTRMMMSISDGRRVFYSLMPCLLFLRLFSV